MGREWGQGRCLPKTLEGFCGQNLGSPDWLQGEGSGKREGRGDPDLGGWRRVDQSLQRGEDKLRGGGEGTW